MCIYKGPAETCASQTILRGLTQEGKNNILEHHNKLRRMVAKGEQKDQPAAANMRELVWDSELEAIAQRLADQCLYEHDEVKNKLDGTSVGQNLFLESKSEKQDQAALTFIAAKPAQFWYNEVTTLDSLLPILIPSRGVHMVTTHKWSGQILMHWGVVVLTTLMEASIITWLSVTTQRQETF